jgi:hypothetical protein
LSFNFPNSPTVGQLYPQPPIGGAPVYQWDGAKWTVATGVVGAVYIGDSAPSNPPPGSLWWNSSNGQLFVYYNDGNSTQWVYASQAAVTPVIRSYLTGLTLSTAGSSASFAVAPGVAADGTNVDMLTLTAALSKTTAAWSAGAGGALDTGAIAASTWYHVHLIKNITTQIVDVLISLSPIAPTLPSGYTEFRRLGAMKTDASSNWTLFYQWGDLFEWGTVVSDLANLINPGTVAVLRTLSVPTGIIVVAIFSFMLNAGAGGPDAPQGVMVTDPATADVAPSVTSLFTLGMYTGASTQLSLSSRLEVRTNVNGQVRTRLQNSASGTSIGIATVGWRDTRGRDN